MRIDYLLPEGHWGVSVSFVRSISEPVFICVSPLTIMHPMRERLGLNTSFWMERGKESEFRDYGQKLSDAGGNSWDA